MNPSSTDLQVQAMTLVTPEFTRNLRTNGFIKIENAVPTPLVNDALKEINKRLGTTKDGTDQFKAKTFPRNPAITNLFIPLT